MTGHDRLCPQRPHEGLENVDGAGHRAHEHEWRPAVEHEVAAEEDRAFGQPDDRVVGGVGGVANVVDLARHVVNPYGHCVAVGEKRRRQLNAPQSTPSQIPWKSGSPLAST